MIAIAARREDDGANDVRKMGIGKLKRVAQDGDRWRTETSETLVFPG